MNYALPIPAIDWLVLAPLLIVMVGGILALMYEMFRPKSDNTGVIVISLLSLFAAGVSLSTQFGQPAVETFGGMVYRDRVGLILQLLTVIASFLVICFSESYLRAKRIPFAEFYPLVLWSTAGSMIMVSTNNLIMMFIGLEVLSIALYVMAGMSKSEQKSEESAIKYFLLGAFSSAFMLMGVAYIYGATGSLSLTAIPEAATSIDPAVRYPLIFGTAILLIGLLFKAAYVPFHQWTPDVYQGSPTNVTAYMAAGSKIAAIGAIYRVTESALGYKEFFLPILGVVAIITMLVGSVIALNQTDVKRIFGYSSIANAGYVLVGIVAHLTKPEEIGLTSVVFYLTLYVAMTTGTFALLTYFARGGQEDTSLNALKGLWQRDPHAAGILLIFVFGLIGIPPLAGFWGKLFLFQDAWQAGLQAHALVLAFSSVVSIFYYLGIVKAAFVDKVEGEVKRTTAPAGMMFTCGVCAIVVAMMWFFTTPLIRFLEPEEQASVASVR